MNKNVDLAIVGMGFAGYTGAIYATRYGIKTVIIGDSFGGQTAEAHLIGNYPGFEEITGLELMQKVQQQAIKLGTEEIYERVEHIEKVPTGFLIKMRDGSELTAKQVMLTIGVTRRKLNVPGEKELYGKGVTYCATCDGFFFKGKNVAVIGGGDTAVTSALYLADICNEVHLLVRGSSLRAEQYWVDKLQKTKNIFVHLNTGITRFEGTDKLERVVTTGEKTTFEVEGVFIEIGHEPNTIFTDSIGVKTDDHGFIIVNNEQETSVKGLYAAGDSTNGSNGFAQLLTAASEAAIAAESIAKQKG
jgi:thioredoxin reductase (NADPH)